MLNFFSAEDVAYSATFRRVTIAQHDPSGDVHPQIGRETLLRPTEITKEFRAIGNAQNRLELSFFE